MRVVSFLRINFFSARRILAFPAHTYTCARTHVCCFDSLDESDVAKLGENARGTTDEMENSLYAKKMYKMWCSNRKMISYERYSLFMIWICNDFFSAMSVN